MLKHTGVRVFKYTISRPTEHYQQPSKVQRKGVTPYRTRTLSVQSSPASNSAQMPPCFQGCRKASKSPLIQGRSACSCETRRLILGPQPTPVRNLHLSDTYTDVERDPCCSFDELVHVKVILQERTPAIIARPSPQDDRVFTPPVAFCWPPGSSPTQAGTCPCAAWLSGGARGSGMG